MVIPGKISYERWRDLLAAWKQIKGIWELGFADFINYGRKQFGEEKVDVALQQLEFDLGDANRALAIGMTPLGLRIEELTVEHYYLLGKAERDGKLTAKERGRWAAVAHKEKLSALELQKSLEAGKVVRLAVIEGMSGRDSGVASIQGISFWFERWESQVGGEEKILSWDKDTKLQFLQHARPIADLVAKVEKSL